MVNYDSEEEVLKRASQEDPIVMYLIVNETLGMGVGKTAAQCGHAVGMLFLEFFEQEGQEHCFGDMSLESKNRVLSFKDWLDNSYRKVVLKADSKEWIKLQLELPKDSFVLVKDRGLTEVPEGSETVIGIFPMKKSEAPKCIKKLQTLK